MHLMNSKIMIRNATIQARPRCLSQLYQVSTSLSLHTRSITGTKMPLAPVRAVAFPSESALSPLYNSAYFIDAFAVSLPVGRSKPYKPDALARTFFSESPAWFSLLMWIRDGVISTFGVKRSTEIQALAEKNGIETIFVFPIITQTKNEIVVGENDSHLNFQTSILIRKDLGAAGDGDDHENGDEMVVMTVVHCHGLFGKAYITIIKFFHVLIVKYSLARMPRRITRKKD
jgi:hypothetical protein